MDECVDLLHGMWEYADDQASFNEMARNIAYRKSNWCILFHHFPVLTGDMSAANRQNSVENRRRHVSYETTSNGWEVLQLQPDEGRKYDLSVLG